MLWYDETKRLALIAALKEIIVAEKLDSNFLARMNLSRKNLFANPDDFLLALNKFDIAKIQELKKYFRDDIQLLHLIAEFRSKFTSKDSSKLSELLILLTSQEKSIKETISFISRIIILTSSFKAENLFWSKKLSAYESNYDAATKSSVLQHTNSNSKVISSANNLSVELHEGADSLGKLVVYDSKVRAAMMSIKGYNTPEVVLGSPEVFIQGNSYLQQVVTTLLQNSFTKSVKIESPSSEVQRMLERVAQEGFSVQKSHSGYLVSAN